MSYLFLKNKILTKIDSVARRLVKKRYDFNTARLPGVPITISAVTISIINYLHKIYPTYKIRKLFVTCENKGDDSCWFIDKNEYLKIGRNVIANEEFLEKALLKFKKSEKNFFGIIKKLENGGVKKDNIESEFANFLDVYMSAFGAAYILTGPMTYGFSDYYLGYFLKKYKNSEEVKEAILRFTKSSENFVKKEKNDLEKINKLLKNKAEGKSLEKLIAAHSKKYYWIGNNYKDSIYLGRDYFLKKFLSLRNENDNSASFKHKPFGLENISRADVRILKLLGVFAGIQDKRKKINMVANYWISEFLKSIGKKYNIIPVLLKFMAFPEIFQLLKNKKVNFKEIQKRTKGVAIISAGNKEYWLSGNNFSKIKIKLENNIKLSNKNMISGQIASNGKAAGFARVVLNIGRDGNKIRKGEVLVTSMTRPEFVPYLRLVKAIITDEGGVTSHAAVVSRELNIPCIIATKYATKVLKDGNLVEVDADNGVIKILKRAK